MSAHMKLFWLVIGMAIGGGVGYLVRERQERTTRGGHLSHSATKKDRKINFQSVAMLVVVVLVVLAAFRSQRSANKANDAQKKIATSQDQVTDVASCSQTFLTITIAALNDRTTFSSQQAQAQVDIQVANEAYLQARQEVPPVSDAALSMVRMNYINVVQHYIMVQQQNATTIKNHPYPTVDDFMNCLKDKQQKESP